MGLTNFQEFNFGSYISTVRSGLESFVKPPAAYTQSLITPTPQFQRAQAIGCAYSQRLFIRSYRSTVARAVLVTAHTPPMAYTCPCKVTNEWQYRLVFMLERDVQVSVWGSYLSTADNDSPSDDIPPATIMEPPNDATPKLLRSDTIDFRLFQVLRAGV